MKSGSTVGSRHGCGLVVLAAVFFRLMMSPAASWATVYYVDGNHPDARDTNPGTEAQPFKTIGKATAVVSAGDTVFVKAGVYRETVILSRSGSATGPVTRTGPTTAPITIMAYPGHEGKAIIDAAEPVTRWHKCTGPDDCAGNPNWAHIYWADVAALVRSHPDARFAVRQLFQRGRWLPPSRYPNTGWSYPTGTPDPMTAFSDDTLSQPDGHFTGAVCHIKTRVWQIDPIPIVDFSGGTITLAHSPRYEITTQFGYFITSVVGEINEEGEWAYDPAQQKIFLWPQGDVPAGVEFSYRRHCVAAEAHTAWNVVRGLTMRHAHRDGIWLYLANHMRLENNTIEYCYADGIRLQSTDGTCDDNQVLHNTTRYCGYCGINVGRNASRNNIEGNYVYATGTDTFGGDLLNGQTQAIYIGGPYTRVYNNRVDRCGYTALYVAGQTLSRDISYNYVTNAGLALADGGGLYAAGYSEVAEEDHIHHNIFVDCLGCLSMYRSLDNGRAPTIGTHSGIMHGVYIDEGGTNRIIEHNTAIGCQGRGICFHWAPSNVVRGNTLYGNRVAQVSFSGKDEPQKAFVNDVLLDNILFATSVGQKTFYLTMNYDNVWFGQSDRNCFYHPYDSAHIFVRRRMQDVGAVEENLTLDGWRALSGYDANSREFSYLEQLGSVALARPTQSRIVYNAMLEVAVVDLEGKAYCDVEGNPVLGAVVLQPFESKILISCESAVPD